MATRSRIGRAAVPCALALAALVSPRVRADEPVLPAHPRELKFPALSWAPPKPAEHRHLLPGDIPCYIVHDRALPVVSVTIRWRGGTACDPAGRTGAGNLLARMMRVGGTAKRTPAEVDAALEGIAAQVGFDLNLGGGTASLRVLSRHLAAGLALFFEMLREPRFDADRLGLERDRALDGMKGRNDDTRGIQEREYDWLLYGREHPAARQTTKAELLALTREELTALHRALVHPSRWIVSVAGDWDPAAAKAALAGFVAAAGPAPTASAAVPDPTAKPAPGVYLVAKPGVTQSRVVLGHLGLREDHPDRYAVGIMNYVLGGGSFASRLTQAIRVDRGLAYSAGSRYSPGQWIAGTFAAAFQSKHATCAEGLRVALAEIARLREQGPTAEEVEQAKASAIEAFPRNFATPEAAAAALADLEWRGLPVDFWDLYRAKIQALTVADVHRAAKTWLRPEAFVILMVGDVDAVLAAAGPEGLGIPGTPTRLALPDPYTLERPADK